MGAGAGKARSGRREIGRDVEVEDVVTVDEHDLTSLGRVQGVAQPVAGLFGDLAAAGVGRSCWPRRCCSPVTCPASLAAADEAVTLCRQSLRANYEALAHGVVARALLRRDGAAGCDRAQAALDTAADLVERTGAHLLAPALSEWRAELAGMRGDIAGRQHWLDAAARGFAAIKMVGRRHLGCFDVPFALHCIAMYYGVLQEFPMPPLPKDSQVSVRLPNELKDRMETYAPQLTGRTKSHVAMEALAAPTSTTGFRRSKSQSGRAGCRPGRLCK